jgi:hypothetical protein
MIPVHVDCTNKEVTAECAKCGKCSSAPVSQKPEEGTLAARKKYAKYVALEKLTDGCEERQPWGSTPEHVERHIPRGVSVYCVGVNGELLPVMCNRGTEAGKLVIIIKRGKQEIPHLGCGTNALIFVAPAHEEFKDAAIEFARTLVRRGYKRARVETFIEETA